MYVCGKLLRGEIMRNTAGSGGWKSHEKAQLEFTLAQTPPCSAAAEDAAAASVAPEVSANAGLTCKLWRAAKATA